MRSYHEAAVLWRPGKDPGILPVAAAPIADRPGSGDIVDLCHLPLETTVVREPSGREHVLLRDGVHTIQLHILKGTVTEGPVHLAFQPERLAVSREEMLTLERFIAFRRDGRFDASLFPPSPKAQRWLLALKVFSQVPPGVRPDYLELAKVHFKNEEVRQWGETNEWIRSRLRRAVEESRALVNGDYLKILSPANLEPATWGDPT